MADTYVLDEVAERPAQVAAATPEDCSKGCAEEAWPAGGLEAVDACPVCASADRDVLHDGLEDRVFASAPGVWRFRQCAACASAYLDPRPTPATLPLAYRRYYTHARNAGTAASEPSSAGFVRRAANGYRSFCLGLNRAPRSRLGALMFRMLPWVPAFLGAEVRGLAPPQAGAARLLDVGCGSGAFVEIAGELGFEARGIDIDPGAVANARARGLDCAVAEIGDIAASGERFDVITSSHVIEHVYDPRAHLAYLAQTLAPGGLLWLETPNLESAGHRRFACNWRDLDAPRHLVLFNRSSLERALGQAGFTDIAFTKRGGATFNTFPVSRALAAGHPRAIDAPPGTLAQRLEEAALDVWAMYVAPHRREFLTVTARKPA